MAETLKVELMAEECAVCGGGGGGELMTPEEYDAAAAQVQVPLRNMLLQLNNNRVVPEGRICASCAHRAADAYEFSQALGARAAPPLSDKIRALRRRLHELTQKIDVFIVVGGPGAGAPASTGYSEEDIIMVEKEALAAAAQADEEDLEHARNTRGDNVYQCSVCPLSFQRVSELRAHAASHPADALHSCWTCGAQFSARSELAQHAASHAAPAQLVCNLCDSSFTTQADMRRHEAGCPARCPVCGLQLSSRGELAAHAAAAHGRAAPAPHACPACFLVLPSAALLAAHQLRHRQARQFVCGYGDCVLRFGTRANLMAHIRKCHAAELPEPPAERPDVFVCGCSREFASAAALKRHARTHQQEPEVTYEEIQEGDVEQEQHEEVVMETEEGVQLLVEGEDGEVEYLELETLDDGELAVEAGDHKPDPALL